MVEGTKRPRFRSYIRVVLLLLAILASPLACCAAVFLLGTLPSSLLPGPIDFTVNLFEAEVKIENRSGETVRITPITTTTGQPEAIWQSDRFRLCDIPLKPNSSTVLTYDAADRPLTGIVVCRADGDCRLLDTRGGDGYYLNSFDNLPALESDWLEAVQLCPRYNVMLLASPLLVLAPVILFMGWVKISG